jgi:Na+-translocating ferredoxin:NAD+ oxidoreductase subunit G
MRDIIRLGIVLMIYSVIAGASLAYVNIMTKDKIISNKAASEDAARKEVLPGMNGGFEPKGSMTVGNYEFPYWIAYTDQGKTTPGGYVFIAKGKGYSSVIETMVGVDLGGKITGIKVVSQQETPGLGTKITEVRYGENDPWFSRQFKGKSADDNIRVKKDGGDIDAMTGATISPRAVTDSINKGLVSLKKIMGGAGS